MWNTIIGENMICSKCGYNNEGAKFCVKCGNILGTENVPNTTPNVAVQNINNNNQMINTQQNIIQTSKSSFNYFKHIITAFIKPIKTFKDEEEKLSEVKHSFILTAIVAGIMMIVNLISSMINASFTYKMDTFTYEYNKVLDLSGIQELDFVSLIFKNLLIYLIVMLVIAGVYYLASLVAKKTVSYPKILSITATSLIPYIAICMIVAPIMGIIWSELAIVFNIIGAIYALIIFICLINENIKFENSDLNVYFHAICMSILGTAGYFVIVKLLTSIIESEALEYINSLN